MKKHGLPPRMPPRLYKDILDDNDRVVVMLEQIDYLLGLEGRRSPCRWAAFNIAKLKEPLSAMRGRLLEIKGVGKTAERIILEILDTGTSSCLDSLL